MRRRHGGRDFAGPLETRVDGLGFVSGSLNRKEGIPGWVLDCLCKCVVEEAYGTSGTEEVAFTTH